MERVQDAHNNHGGLIEGYKDRSPLLRLLINDFSIY